MADRRSSRAASPRGPAWARAVDSIHAADRSVAAVGADASVLLGATLAGGLGLAAAPVTVGTLVVLWVTRVYAVREPLETQGIIWYPPLVAGPYAASMLAAVALAPALGVERGALAAVALGGAGGLLMLRTLTWAVLVLARCHGVGLRPALIVGDGPLAELAAQKLRDNPAAGLAPVGVASPTGLELGAGAAFAARPDDLPSVVRRHRVEVLVIVLDATVSTDIEACLDQCEDLGLQLAVIPPMADLFLRPEHVAQVAGLALLPLGAVHRGAPVDHRPGQRFRPLRWPTAPMAPLLRHLPDVQHVPPS